VTVTFDHSSALLADRSHLTLDLNGEPIGTIPLDDASGLGGEITARIPREALQAWNHLQAVPGHRALVVAAEICSAAYFLDDRLESAVAHAIFADGAGALALSADGAGPALLAHRTLFRPEHLPAMGFEYPGGRPRVVLSKDVRRIGATMMGEMARALMETQGLKRADVRYWVLHSAGRRVLDRARDLLELSDAHLEHARGVLREFGNMSSATILFVLERTLRLESPVPGEWGLMIGLGPGFAAEGALLRW
jgi:alkylresorcinol/alkylpyrone synthase